MTYDCFMFFDELDMLEIRLNVLAPHVDFFVLVEATETHSGISKPLYFKENIHRYDAFLPKIKHISVSDLPHSPSNRWVAENAQRNAISRGLETATNNDWIVVSDVDEIWNPKALERPPSDHFAMTMLPIPGWLNGVPHNPRQLVVAAKYEVFSRRLTPQKMRDSRELIPGGNPCGWAFSWIRPTPADVDKKLKAFAHREWDDVDGRRTFNEKISTAACIPPKECHHWPEWLKLNYSKYPHLIKTC